jgi:nephrocystin-3
MNDETALVLFQFDATEDSSAEHVKWLPAKLSPNVRCVLSMINDSQCHKHLTSDSIEPKPKELNVPQLDEEARRVNGTLCAM